MTREARNRQIVVDETESIFNRKEIDAFESFFTVDFVDHSPGGDRDRGTYCEDCRITVAAFPDLHVACDEVIAEGDTVVKRWTATGTHRGPYAGMLASGRRISVTGMYMYRIRDGKISEQWRAIDSLGMLQQLGAIPQPAEAAK